MKHILNTLAFYAEFQGWYSFNKRHSPTVKAVKALERRGYLEVNQFSQARHTGKTFN